MAEIKWGYLIREIHEDARRNLPENVLMDIINKAKPTVDSAVKQDILAHSHDPNPRQTGASLHTLVSQAGRIASLQRLLGAGAASAATAAMAAQTHAIEEGSAQDEEGDEEVEEDGGDEDN